MMSTFLARRKALAVLLLTAAALLAACGGGGADDAETQPGVTAGLEDEVDVEETAANPEDASPEDADTANADVTALDAAYTTGLSNDDARFPSPLIDVELVGYGLPAPDLIPAINDPVMSPIDEIGDWLDENEAVVVVQRNGDTRGYPVRVLMNHEIVNDVVGGDPVTVTYCPLCNSALAFVRIVDGQETTFGVSGMLFNSALVMYDRLTESLWLHYTGQAVVGERTGDRLDWVSSGLLSFADLEREHPEALVLNPRNRERYGANPYSASGTGGVPYDTLGSEPFLFGGVTDPRAESMQRVVGVEIDGESKAWTRSVLAGGLATVTPATVGEQDLVIFWQSGQVSALAGPFVSNGDVVGSVGVFVPEADGQTLTFSVEGDRFVDAETSSTWNIFGEAVDGPLAGSVLERRQHLDTFWFAWSAYRPTTDLVTAEGTISAG